jgi:septum site-determining protein MinC
VDNAKNLRILCGWREGSQTTLLAKQRLTLLRGRRDGLEVRVSSDDLDSGFTKLQARLTERPSFFRGTSAVVDFGSRLPTHDDLARLRKILDEAGVTLRALAGSDDRLPACASEASLEYQAPRLSASARSLVADFAGARNDIAQRRQRGDSSVPRLPFAEPARPTPTLQLVEAGPSTLYHAATLRGGQVLHHSGNIVVVGDVNPGAELVACGDVLVFGRLAGIAHAGAQGDESARILAVELRATQLRIATFIAANSDVAHAESGVPEVAFARDGRIVIVTLDRLDASMQPEPAS